MQSPEDNACRCFTANCIDVRRRGTSGTQADLYIRAEDQTLLLIDGFKVDDAQTGHHMMNLSTVLKLLREFNYKIASRVYRKCFTGAVISLQRIRLINDASLRLRRVLMVNLLLLLH
jgi:iron complex outermembrane receptor protein